MQWKGPCVIQEVVDPNNYKVKVGRRLKTYHANLLKKYADRDIGHRLSEGVKGLHDDNVQKIMEAARPTTKKQVRAFMGLANYYREYVPNFAAVTTRLTDLLKKGQRAFQTVRTLLTRRPIL